MPFVENRECTDDNATFCRDTRIEGRIVGLIALSDTTHQILQGFHNAVLDADSDSIMALREEREHIGAELRENLAQNNSLRRKDFDDMMHDIISMQHEREEEGRTLINDYFRDQKNIAEALRDNLATFKNSLINGEVQRVKEFRRMINEILAEQDKRKNEVTVQLKEFQKGQQAMIKRLKNLLAKGRELRIRDIKALLHEFNADHKERTACMEKRRREVCNMLERFKNQRTMRG